MFSHREYVTSTMRLHEPDGFANREPTSRRIVRTQLVSLGPHHEWSGDGHDKLSSIGLPIWGIRDVFSGKWLGLWVVPSNRHKKAVAYLYLDLVETSGGGNHPHNHPAWNSSSFKGMPIQMTTDCGSETVEVFGLGNALRYVLWSCLDVRTVEALYREIFSPDLPIDELPAHRFLRSVNNITVERGWLQLRVRWGDNVKIFWDAGIGIYNPANPKQ
jgi:hypothetical protein